jgi:hypothetical protein
MNEEEPGQSAPEGPHVAPGGNQQQRQPVAAPRTRSVTHTVKCGIVGGLWSVGGIMMMASGASGSVFGGLLVLAYGIWVLSGIATGGWRILIY